jgi:hypothetical protein
LLHLYLSLLLGSRHPLLLDADLILAMHSVHHGLARPGSQGILLLPCRCSPGVNAVSQSGPGLPCVEVHPLVKLVLTLRNLLLTQRLRGVELPLLLTELHGPQGLLLVVLPLLLKELVAFLCELTLSA